MVLATGLLAIKGKVPGRRSGLGGERGRQNMIRTEGGVLRRETIFLSPRRLLRRHATAIPMLRWDMASPRTLGLLGIRLRFPPPHPTSTKIVRPSGTSKENRRWTTVLSLQRGLALQGGAPSIGPDILPPLFG